MDERISRVLHDYDKKVRYIRKKLLLFSGLLLVFNTALFVLMNTFYVPDTVSGTMFILAVLAATDVLFFFFVLFIAHVVKKFF